MSLLSFLFPKEENKFEKEVFFPLIFLINCWSSVVASVVLPQFCANLHCPFFLGCIKICIPLTQSSMLFCCMGIAHRNRTQAKLQHQDWYIVQEGGLGNVAVREQTFYSIKKNNP